VTQLRLPPPEGVRILDVELFGAANLSCCYVVDAAEPALIETGPATVLDAVVRGLERMQVTPRHVVLTHIHLDHAGGAGHVARLFPDATIWVHEVGARHVVDPTRLIASARRIYGDALESMWGVPDPVADRRIRAIDEGTVIPLGDRELRVMYTPGHASHEVTLYEPDSGAAFIGDTAGVCLAEEWQKPATPPPEFDLEAALESIERVRGLKASALCFTHFGPANEPALDKASQDLRRWDAVLKPMVLADAPMEDMVAALRRAHGPNPGDEIYKHATEKLSSYESSIGGYVRYYRKQLGG
jgi:glyoxylase-like metal-dependent hydrolase (beta-lactamase superfamily II)